SVAAIPIMDKIGSGFDRLGEIAKAHPDLIRFVGEGLGALAVGLIAIGTVAIMGVLISYGGATGLLALFGEGLATFISLDFKGAISGIKMLVEGIDNFF